MAGQDESHTQVADLQVVRKDAAQIARGAVLAGRYEIEGMLGRGGAGVVLRAFDRELREAVAIKVLHPDLAQETRWIERLAREVKLARQLRHPNVCRVFDFEKADGHVFIVMELAAGGSMRHELHDEAVPARGAEARLADARAVAEGLAAIHKAGIAHRDVTPQNILRMADGRLVVSDFGLATEVSQTTASVHGGTIAYMAPEVVRGQRADFAADVWSLGVVIHEIMFGARPTWNKATGGSMLTPAAGRTLAKAERLAYDVCRACTAERPRARPASAGEVAAWLGGQRRTPRYRNRRWVAFATLATIALLAGATRLPWSRRDVTTSPPLELTGEPADWTDISTVHATVDGQIHCLVSLPGTEAVRFAWGSPKQVDDVDLGTGQRRPSPLVPEARKEGCAQPSPDGKHVAYQGYVPDGRAFAFVSDRPDGSGGVPVVPIADPSLRSDPIWLSGSNEFVIDIDQNHAGVYSLETRRTRVLPEVTARRPLSVFRSVVGSTIFVLGNTSPPPMSDIAGFSWPAVSEQVRFRLPDGLVEIVSPNEKILFTTGFKNNALELWRIEPAKRSLKRLAGIRDQDLRIPTFTKNHLVFISRRDTTQAWRLLPDGRRQPLTYDRSTLVLEPCGRGLAAIKGDGTLNILDSQERSLFVSRDHAPRGVACSPDGTIWYAFGRDDVSGILRCNADGCSRLVEGEIWSLAVSPNGERLIFAKTAPRGLTVSVTATTGGASTELIEADVICPIGWSSDRTIWVPKRRDGKHVWVELDVETRAPTGRTKEGAHDCADGYPDPASPVEREVQIVTRSTSQVRSIPSMMLGL